MAAMKAGFAYACALLCIVTSVAFFAPALADDADLKKQVEQGNAAYWVAACDQIIAWDVETVVPGHGPITDKKGVQAMKDYLLYIKAEARRRYDAGMPVFQAARDIALDRFAGWGDPERMVVNVASLYREFGSKQELGIMELFAEMGRFHTERKGHGHAH
jgi:cyclase